MKASVLLYGTLIGTLILSGCSVLFEAKNQTLDFASQFVPLEVIQTLDKQSWKAMQTTLQLNESKEALGLLEAVAEPITRAAEEMGSPSFAWNFHIVQSEDLNAFALPGGTIAVNTGLIEYSESGLELVGVLGHEVAHVFAKHGLKSLIVRSGASLLLSFILGDFGQISGLAVEKLAGLGLLKFSRDHEREADALGAKILENAGYPSIGLKTFFTALPNAKKGKNPDSPNAQGEAENPDWARKTMSLFSTHPMSEERSKNLEDIVRSNKVTTLNSKATSQLEKLRAIVKK